MNFDRDIGALIDPDNLDINSGYGGGDYTGATAARHQGQEQQEFRSATLFVATANGTAGDTIVATLQSREDGGTWSDATDIDGNTVEVTLNDASGSARKDVDLTPLKENLRVRLDTGDQTVGGSIDLVTQIVLGGGRIVPVQDAG